MTRSQKLLYSAFVTNQRRAMDKDPHLVAIKQRIKTIHKVFGGPFESLTHREDLRVLQEMHDLIVSEKYRGLKTEPFKLLPSLPLKLSLEQIDKRLQLFKAYMEYRLDNLDQWDCMMRHFMQQWREYGMFFHYEEPDLQTFDGWLYLNGFHDLVELIVIF